MLAQDMDLDGKPDVISCGTGAITIAKNKSTPGTLDFERFDVYPGGSSVAVADFDGDGRRDIAVPNYVIRNSSTPGNLAFEAATYVAIGGYQIATGDFNKDGRIDIVQENGNEMYVLLNTSTGPGNISFQNNAINIGYVGGRCTGLQAADVDGDGLVDVLATQGDYNRALTLHNTSTIGASTVSFESAEFWPSGGSYPYRCQVADFDKDGKIDLTTCNYQGATNTAIFRNTSTIGDISFASSVNLDAPGANYRIAVGDANGDGYPDIVTKSLGQNVFSVYPNTSTGPGVISFDARVDYYSSAMAEVSGIVIADLDGDFVPDIATSGISSNTIRFHRNNSSQTDNTPPTATCKNITVALSPSGSVDVTAFMIDNGSSDACGIASLKIDNADSKTFTCANIGANQVELKVTDRAGNVTTCTATVTVAAAAVIVAGQSTVCAGQTVALAANQGDTYQWYKNGVAISGATTRNYTATTSGNYTVAVTNAGGCSGTSSAETVTIIDNPSINVTASGSTNLCQGNTVTLTADAASFYTWSNGAGTQAITTGTAGTYTVTVFDANGCSATSAPISVTIKAGALPSAAISTSGATTFCDGGSVVLSVPAATTYEWSNGATTQSITVAQSGTFSVKVTNADGCFTTSTPTAVTVKEVPTVNAGQDVTVCPNTPVQLNAVGASSTTPVAINSSVCLFDAPGGNGCTFTSDICGEGYEFFSNRTVTQSVTSSLPSNLSFKLYYTPCTSVTTFTFFVNGQQVGTYTDNTYSCTCSPGGYGTFPRTITLSAADYAAAWVNGSNTLSVQVSADGSGVAVSGIVATVQAPGATYSWSPATGLNNATIANPIATVSATTNYTVSYSIGNGCVATDNVAVNVTSAPPTAICRNATAIIGANGTASITAADINNGSSSACGAVTLGFGTGRTSYTCADIGQTFTVVLKVTDVNGLTSTCNAQVTVTDPNRVCNQPPVAVCKAITLSAGSNCTATAAASAFDGGSTDPNGDAITFSVAPAGPYALGTTQVVLTVTDSKGASSTCSASVTVKDNTAPVPNVATLATITGECSAAVTAVPKATDNCSGIITATTADPVSYTQQGTYTIHWIYTDAAGNTTPQNQTVIVKDVTPPVIACAFDVTVNVAANTCGAVVTYNAPSATDNCGNGNLPTAINGYTYKGTFGGHTYFISNTATTPEDAHAKAIALGGHLVTISNAQENAFVAAMNPAYIWIGYTDRDVEGTFKWVTSEAVSYTNWNSGEPNNAGNEDWAVINWGPNGTWNDWTYTSAALFVVEFEGGSIPTTRIGGLGSGATFPIGTTTETWEAVDAGGNRSTCSFKITVVDNQNPTIVGLPANISVSNDAGLCGARVSWTAPTSADNCTGHSISQTSGIANGGVFPIGTSTVTYRAVDARGNSAVASFTVTVTDREAPVLNGVPANATVECKAVPAAATVTATDNCAAGAVQYSETRTNGNCVSNYTLNRVWTVSDAKGNVTTATQVITVQDTQAPTLNVPADVSVAAESGKCSAVVTYSAATASDACGTATIAYSQASGTVFPVGVTVVTVTATDACGLTTVRTFNVRVNDTQAPTITCPAPQTINLDASCSASLPDYRSLLTAADNCSGALTVVQTPAAGSFVSGTGAMTITFKVTDASNNTSTCTMQLTKKDVTPPSIICPQPITQANDLNRCGAVVSFAAPVVTDECASGVTGVHTLASGQAFFDYANNVMESQFSPGLPMEFFPTDGQKMVVFLQSGSATHYLQQTFTVGAAPATLSFDMKYTNHYSSFSSSQFIAVQVLNPTTGALLRTLFQTGAGAPLSTSMTSYSYDISEFAGQSIRLRIVDATINNFYLDVLLDNVKVAGSTLQNGSFEDNYNGWTAFSSQSSNGTWGIGTGPGTTVRQIAGLASGSLFPIGQTVNTFEATDASGNKSTCSFIVKVEDRQVPVISCPGNKTTIATSAAGAVVTYNTPVGTDNCTGAVTTMVAGLPSGATFPIGTTTVTYKVTDAAGLSSQCSFDVTVVGIAPQINCPANITVNSAAGRCDANVSFTATETTAIPASTITYSIQPGSIFAVGTHEVTATATNAVGTSSCTFTVTVVDAEVPVLIGVPADVTVECDAVPAAATVTATDNCAAGEVNYAETRTNGNCISNYTLNRVWTVRDIHGNVTTAKQVVTVRDTKAPVLEVNNVVVTNDAGNCGAVVSFAGVSSDNCSTPVITYDVQPGTYFAVGTTTVTATATDACGNATTRTFKVTVNDSELPAVRTNSFTIQLNAAGAATITKEQVNNGSTDNCGIASIAIDKSSFDCSNVGANTVTLTVTDIHGNVNTATATITVEDKVAPLITCPASVTLNCQDATSVAANGTATATDACGIASITSSDVSTQNPSVNSPAYYNYTITRTWTATDKNGNASSCVQTITVRDITAPSVTTAAASLDRTVECSDAAAIASALALAPTATDICAPVALHLVSDVRTANCGTTYTRVRKWNFTDVTGNTSTVFTQTLSVVDRTAPSITANAVAVELCYDSLNQSNYPVAALQASDNCNAVTYSYVVKDAAGASVRSGNTSNASGSFPVGANTIYWTVTDACGNATPATTTVRINAPINGSFSSFTANGGNPNTLYTSSYAPAASSPITITATGGTAPYSYAWSIQSGNAATITGGAGTATATVNATGSGTVVLAVVVTDSKGCRAIFRKTVQVIDARCGNNGDKVLVCHNTGSAKNPWVQICVAPSAVPAQLGNGSYLGACSGTPATARQVAQPKSEEPAVEATVLAFPNPSRGLVNLRLQNLPKGKVRIVVMDGLGKVVLEREASTSYRLEDVSLDLQKVAAGVYSIRIQTDRATLQTKVAIAR